MIPHDPAGGRTRLPSGVRQRAAAGEHAYPVPAEQSGHGGEASETAVRYTWVMPKIFEQDGYSFFFYSNDHAPIHVHVRRGGGEAVFVVEPEVELRESVGFNVRELSRAEDLIDDHLELIKQKWAEHLG